MEKKHTRLIVRLFLVMLFPLTGASAQTDNPRGIYKLVGINGRDGRYFKEPFDQYKICTDKATLMMSISNKSFRVGNNDRRVFNYTGSEPSSADDKSTLIYDSDNSGFKLKWWSTYTNHLYFPKDDWCIEKYESGKYSDRSKILFDALTGTAEVDAKNPLNGTWRFIGYVDELRDVKKELPKLHEKAIIRLEPDEVASMLDLIEKGGDKLKGQALAYYKKTKQRDLAIATLLLGTGLRVSECVGLDLGDVDFKNNSVKVVRKGGNEMIVYFGEEVEKALTDYIEGDRKKIEPLKGHENALFYSLQRRRIGVQAIENMIKKYAIQIAPNKHITPHKLRSTYGTTLYKETGDIYLVADVLGHKDVNTTRKHYAAIDENRRRQAAGVVQLREKE